MVVRGELIAMSPRRKPAAASAMRKRQKSSPSPCGSKIGPGEAKIALQPPRLDRQQAAEGELAGLQRGEIVLARDRNPLELIEGSHVLRADRSLARPDARLVEDAPHLLGTGVRPGHGLAQPRPQVGPPGGGILLL